MSEGATSGSGASAVRGAGRRLWGSVVALAYGPFIAATERAGNAERRAELLSRAQGRVVELGAGTGHNLEHYPPGVDLYLTEPEAPMLRRLARRVGRSGRHAQVVQAPAAELPFPDDFADTVVSTLVLCTVPDQAAALAEARRVLRPGGALLFIEHVAAPRGTRMRRWQDRLERPWRAFACGCTTNRETEAAIEAAGFELDRIERGELEREALLVPLIWGEAHPG